jgi:hypothetical protein
VSELPLRDIKDGPFCWQSKAALRKVRDNVADMKIGSSILKVYSALTEIASDEQSEIFETTQPHIATKALLSTATVKRALPILEELSALKITPNARPGSKLKAPNTYALLPIAHCDPSIAHSKKHGQLSQSRRILEESKKNKEALGTFVPFPGNGPLAGSLNSLVSSLSSPKEETQEPTWFGEIRAMHPGTTIERDLKHIERWARKKGKPFTRDLVLNALRRNPPKKPGQREGYAYQGKFIGKLEANALAIKNREFQLNAKRAIKHTDGQIEIANGGAS